MYKLYLPFHFDQHQIVLFFIVKCCSLTLQSDECLPTSQTCFFQLRVPHYSSREVLCERLRYAIRNCRSIDMDSYMLRTSGSMDTNNSDDEIIL